MNKTIFLITLGLILSIIIFIIIIILKKHKKKETAKTNLEEIDENSANAVLFNLNQKYNEDLDKTQIINISEEEIEKLKNISKE